MDVRIARGLAGALGATGTAVVIDVLRAFTTAAYACAAGAREIELVATPDEGRARKRADPALVLVGEVGGRPIDGFDHGNSPAAMHALDLAGRALVLRTSSGVQGALAALATCEHLLLGSLVTAAATVRAARALGRDVTLIPMGSEHGPDGPEDDACAELLAARLAGRPDALAEVERRVRASPAALQACDPALDWITPADLDLALAFDRFDFALAARMADGRVLARRLQPGAARA
jgi:2-phosphosulfolactate phosphatase